MNYSQSEIKRKQQEITSASRKMKYRMEELFTYGIVILLVILLAVFIFEVVGTVRSIINSAPKIDEIDLFAEGEASVLYDTTGEAIQTLRSGNISQEYVSIEKIPACVQQAFVAIEDKRFYEHHGVDMFGVVQSIYSHTIGKDEMIT